MGNDERYLFFNAIYLYTFFACTYIPLYTFFACTYIPLYTSLNLFENLANKLVFESLLIL